MVVGSWINEPVFQCSSVLFFGRYTRNFLATRAVVFPSNAASLAFHRAKKTGCWQQLYTMCTDKSLALVSSYTSPNDCQRLYFRSCSAILRYVIWLSVLWTRFSPARVRAWCVCLSVCEQARTVFWARLPKLTQLMSSVNIRAGRPISLCSGTTFESAGQCLHRGYTAVCTHSPRSVAAGVTEHGSRPQQALLDRKTVASRKRNINAPFSCHFAGVQYSFSPSAD